ncbi:MAG: hypothetical protein HC906_12005 [Bacteroidales bacterium]|nr:hypothetical protein [Bacteroidales bacterium]
MIHRSVNLIVAMLVVGIVSLQAQNVSNKMFNILKYGAKGDGRTVNTESINNAVSACANAGGGTVVIPKGTFHYGHSCIEKQCAFIPGRRLCYKRNS